MGSMKAQILAEEIGARLEAGRVVGEELYRRLFDVLSEMAVEGVGDDGTFALLLHDVRAAYRYDGASNLEGFDIGACWAAMSLLASCESYSERATMWRECVAKVERHSAVFETLEKMPGIKQHELAEAMSCGTSNMSQRLAKLEPYKLFAISIEGKSKRYYLTPKGRRALEEARTRSSASSGGRERVQLKAAVVESLDTGNTMTYYFARGPELHIPANNTATSNDALGRTPLCYGENGRLGEPSVPNFSLSNTFIGRQPTFAN